jgi:hypothetical protein
MTVFSARSFKRRLTKKSKRKGKGKGSRKIPKKQKGGNTLFRGISPYAQITNPLDVEPIEDA